MISQDQPFMPEIFSMSLLRCMTHGQFLIEKRRAYLLGKNLNNLPLPYNKISTPDDIQKAREEIMSYAVARLLRHRFQDSPANPEIQSSCDGLLLELGYNPNFVQTDYSNGSPRCFRKLPGTRHN